jgi:hypothetical protein
LVKSGTQILWNVTSAEVLDGTCRRLWKKCKKIVIKKQTKYYTTYITSITWDYFTPVLEDKGKVV